MKNAKASGSEDGIGGASCPMPNEADKWTNLQRIYVPNKAVGAFYQNPVSCITKASHQGVVAASDAIFKAAHDGTAAALAEAGISGGAPKKRWIPSIFSRSNTPHNVSNGTQVG